MQNDFYNVLKSGDVNASLRAANGYKQFLLAELGSIRTQAADAKKAGGDSLAGRLQQLRSKAKDLGTKATGVDEFIDRVDPLTKIRTKGGQGLIFAPPAAGEYVRIPMYVGGVNTVPAALLSSSTTSVELSTESQTWMEYEVQAIEVATQNVTNGARSQVTIKRPEASGGATLLASNDRFPAQSFRMENSGVTGIRYRANIEKSQVVTLTAEVLGDLVNTVGSVLVYATVIAKITWDSTFAAINSGACRAAFGNAFGDIFDMRPSDKFVVPTVQPAGVLERIPFYAAEADEMNALETAPCVWFCDNSGTITTDVFSVSVTSKPGGITDDFELVGVEFDAPTGVPAGSEITVMSNLRVGNGINLLPHGGYVPTNNYLGEEGANGGGWVSRGGFRYYPGVDDDQAITMDLGIFDASTAALHTQAAETAPVKLSGSYIVHRLSNKEMNHPHGVSIHDLLVRAAQACGC